MVTKKISKTTEIKIDQDSPFYNKRYTSPNGTLMPYATNRMLRETLYEAIEAIRCTAFHIKARCPEDEEYVRRVNKIISAMEESTDFVETYKLIKELTDAEENRLGKLGVTREQLRKFYEENPKATQEEWRAFINANRKDKEDDE